MKFLGCGREILRFEMQNVNVGRVDMAVNVNEKKESLN